MVGRGGLELPGLLGAVVPIATPTSPTGPPVTAVGGGRIGCPRVGFFFSKSGSIRSTSGGPRSPQGESLSCFFVVPKLSLCVVDVLVLVVVITSLVLEGLWIELIGTVVEVD